MSSKSPEPRSIASQLVFLFTLSAAFLLCCGLGVLYWIFVRHAYEEDNEFLTDKVFALRATLDRSNDPGALNEDLKFFHAGEQMTYWIRLSSEDGVTLAETPGMDALLPASVFPQPQDAGVSIGHPEEYWTNGQLFSIVALRVEARGKSVTLQVAQDRTEDEKFIKEFRAVVVAVLILGSLASTLIALKVTRRGLRPLEEMTRSLKGFGPERLHERIPSYRWPRELQPLAVAFDEMFDRLEDSFTRLSQFSADLAHELRTPIANIRGEGEVALTRVRTPDEYREVLESSVAECEKLSRIVDNLLFLARAEGAERQIEPALFGGREAVEKLVAFFEPLAEEHQIRLTCTGEGKVYADPMLFGRAVSNLVENALRNTPAGGAVEISVETTSVHSLIAVKDTGDGIAPEHLPRVFDRFYRADTSRSSHGSGLGLALVKSIMDLHRGSAVVRSEVNQGTVVTLTFPNQTA